jgi:amino acid transporter
MTRHVATSSDASLVRAVGTWGLAAAIVNITVGGGIFRLPASVAGTIGSAAPLAYLVCAVAMGLIVLCFAEAGSRVSLTGGLYAYIEVAFGRFVGFVCGVLLWLGLTTAVAAVTSFFADSLAALLPGLESMAARATTMVLLLAGLSVLNVLGIRGASRFNTVMTIAKLLPLAIVIMVGLFLVRTENLIWQSIPPPNQIARASVVLMFAFLGVEAALVPSGEVRDPSRSVPRAVLLAIGGIALLYMLVQLVTQGLLGPALAGQRTPLAEAASVALGIRGRQLVLVGSSLSMFGFVSGMTLAAPRMLFAFARDGFLPRRLAAVHPRFRTPHWAIAIQSVVIAALAASGSFEWLVIIANGAVLLVYAACCLAVVELRRRDVRESGTPFRIPSLSLVPWLALAVIIALLSTLQLKEWIAVLSAVAGAALLYAAGRARRPVIAAEGAGD